MAKVAIVILAGTETHEGLGRVVNALDAAKDLVAQGVQLAGEYEGHPGVRRLVHEGYQIITF
jgi:hypothetical protein